MILLIATLQFLLGVCASPSAFIRVNHLGYKPNDTHKTALLFANHSLTNYRFALVDHASHRVLWGPAPIGPNLGAWAPATNHYRLAFANFTSPARHVAIALTPLASNRVLQLSKPFNVANDIYDGMADHVLFFVRQQRCGYNPFLAANCHLHDSKTEYGFAHGYPDGTFLNLTGGWHDAADMLRFMLTSGNSVARMLFAYRENPTAFGDHVDYMGHSVPNGVPDVLDEAKWGLDWMLRMHPAPDQLFAQVADDRDHREFAIPTKEKVNYGWGPGAYRPGYYATGKPQGLFQYKNNSTGIANLAGRYAAAMAMAHSVWMKRAGGSHFANTCLQAGKEVYDMGIQQPGVTWSTPCISPYEYSEVTWTDDMEWGAAELYRETREQRYLRDAIRFAHLANDIGWATRNVTLHYQWYPFVNLAHFSLHSLVDTAMQQKLVQFYDSGLAQVAKKASTVPYGVAHPFFWCSNNFAAALVSQVIVFEQMSGSNKYEWLKAAARDWLLGRNPWGVGFVLDVVPGEAPHYPQNTLANYTGRSIGGGLVDGPLWTDMWLHMRGVHLDRPDPYKAFQSSLVTYHDNLWDYATNEPTLDGSCETLHFFSTFAQ